MIPIRIGAYAAACLAVLAAGAYVTNLKLKASRLDAAEARAEQIEAQAKVDLTELERRHKATVTVLEAREHELDTLKAVRAATPVRIVRMCRNPVMPNAVTDTGATASADARASATGVLPQEPGPDIGGRLYADADIADEIVKDCRALQGYVRDIMLTQQ